MVQNEYIRKRDANNDAGQLNKVHLFNCGQEEKICNFKGL